MKSMERPSDATAAAGGPPPSSGSKRKWINVDIVKAIDPESIVTGCPLGDRTAAKEDAGRVVDNARANVTEQFQILQNEVAERTGEVNTLADEVTKLRGELAGKTEELSNLNERIQELSSGLESFCSTMGSGEGNIEDLLRVAESFNTGEGEGLGESVKSLVEALNGKLKELKDLKDKKEQLEGEVESKKSEIEELSTQLEKSKGEVESLKSQVESLKSELTSTQAENSGLQTQIQDQQEKIRKIEESVSAALAGAKEAGLVANASSEAVADADDDIKTLETGISGLISTLEKATEEIKDVGKETEKAEDSIRAAFSPLISGESGEGVLKPEGKAASGLREAAEATQGEVREAKTPGEAVRAEVKGFQKAIKIIGAKQKNTKAKLNEMKAKLNEVMDEARNAILQANAETGKANKIAEAARARNSDLERRLRELEAENERLRQGLLNITKMEPPAITEGQDELNENANTVLGELKERSAQAKVEVTTLLETLKKPDLDDESGVLTQLLSALKMWFRTLGKDERGQVLVFLKEEGFPQGKKDAFLESLVDGLNDGEVKPEDITFADAVRKAIEEDTSFDQDLKRQLATRLEALRRQQ